MSNYIFATLNVTEDGDGWSVKEGPHEELVGQLNLTIAKFGPPLRHDMVENSHADVMHIRWASGKQIRYVMHKRPKYEVISCPSCRGNMQPPEWGGRTSCHGWVPHWKLDPVGNVWKCNLLQKET